MDINEIRRRYNDGYYNCQMEVPKMVAESHIFDENFSVKRNREMVIEYNQAAKSLKEEKNRKQAELYQQLTNDVIEYIVDNYGMNKEQACIIERYVYEEHHAFMCEYFVYIDEVAGVVENILKTSNS